MTRLELLKILVGQARANGFEFRRWYTTRLGVPWISANAAFQLLDQQRRYYALLFSHEFAEAFWHAGADITFQVPNQTFQRVMPDGSINTVTRKSFTRRSARRDVWRYHLSQMALAEEPLRYMRKYLAVEDQLDEDPSSTPIPNQSQTTTPKPTTPTKLPARQPPGPKPKRQPKPLSKEPPNFLRRPYP